jgi:hypothetical protein
MLLKVLSEGHYYCFMLSLHPVCSELILGKPCLSAHRFSILKDIKLKNFYSIRYVKQNYTLKGFRFKWINQPDAAISQVYHLSFKYSSTCFAHHHAHQQELINCLRVCRWNVVVAVSLVVVGPDRTRPTTLLPPRSNGKPEAATAVVELLMMGLMMPETCWAVFKRQVINLRNCCIWLVDSFECMMMHGLENSK